MENSRVDLEKQREIQKKHTRILIAMLVVVAAYVIYTFITNQTNILLFQILIGAFILVFTLLFDVVEPKKLGLFENMTLGQRSAYIKIVLLDILGIGAMLFWILGMGKESNNTLYALVIYVLTVQFKRRVRPEFEEDAEDEDSEE